MKSLKQITIRKSHLIPMLFVATLFLGAVSQASAASIVTTKDQAKANIPLTFTASGLNVSTQYTFYAGTALKANKSTSASATTLSAKFVLGDELVGTFVSVQIRGSAGSVVHATAIIEVVDVVPQHTIDMLGGLMPLIMIFGVVLSIMTGIPQAIVRKVGDF